MKDVLNAKKENFSQAIQKRRINLGLDLIDLSKLIGDNGFSLSKNTLKRIEEGSLNPSLEQTLAILIALDCEISINNEVI